MPTQPAESLPETDWFRGAFHHPALPGYYRVRNSRPLSANSKFLLVGDCWRYWSGSQWLTSPGGHGSVFGRHDSHEWCGLRMWVLRTDTVFGAMYFAHSVRGGKVNLQPKPMNARPFDSEAKAKTAAKRLSGRNLGFTAVLA